MDLGQNVSVHGSRKLLEKSISAVPFVDTNDFTFYIFMTTRHVFQNCYYLKAVENH